MKFNHEYTVHIRTCMLSLSLLHVHTHMHAHTISGESPNGPIVKQIMDHPRCAKLKEGDIILEVNGEKTISYLHSELSDMLERYLMARITVWRMPQHPRVRRSIYVCVYLTC